VSFFFAWMSIDRFLTALPKYPILDTLAGCDDRNEAALDAISGPFSLTRLILGSCPPPITHNSICSPREQITRSNQMPGRLRILGQSNALN